MSTIYIGNTLPDGYIQVGPCGALTWVSAEAAAMIGYEGMGPQKTDAVDPNAITEKELGAAIDAAAREYDGAFVDAAISALHRQHTFDGRPARYLPETQ